LTRRKYRFTASTLSEWRDAFLAGGAEALKVRQEAQLDEQGRRMNDAIAEMAIEIELLRERIRRMEDLKMFCGFAQLDQPGRTLPSSGAWRTRSLFCGGGRACEPCPIGLHRAILRAGSGLEGMEPATVDLQRAAPAASVPAAACPPCPKNSL